MNNEPKYNCCEIVGDLLPLYADGVCSKDSQAFIENHIKECEKCRTTLQKLQSSTEESILGKEKNTALALHRTNRDGRTIRSILLAIGLAYLPLVFIAPLFASETGLAPTNYPFRLLVVFLYTLPFFTALISLGFTVSKILTDDFKASRSVPELIATAVTLLCCFHLDGAFLYLALLGSVSNIILWILSAVRNKNRGQTPPICKKTFLFSFFAVFTVFLAFIIAFTAVIETNGKRPEKDEYAALQTDEAAL